MKIDRALLARIGRLRLSDPGAASGALQGDRRSRAVGGGVTFADHRAYTPGDDLRHVDWNAYGRLNTLLVRLYNEDRDQVVRIIVDASGSMGVGAKLDHAGALAASLALLGLLGRDTVQLAVIGGVGGVKLVEGRDPSALPAMLSTLERTEPGEACDTRAELLRAARGSVCDRVFLLSDLLLEDDAQDEALKALAATGRGRVLLHVLSEDDLSPPLDDAARVLDAETGEERVVGGGPEVQAAYAATLAAWRAGVATRCARRGVRLVPAETRRTPEALLFDSLRRARVVAGR